MEIADQPQVAVSHVVLQGSRIAGIIPGALPVLCRQRKVVVDARNGLHQPPVAVAEAVAIDFFHAGDIGTAVLGHRNAVIAVHHTGHAGRPEHLVVQLAVGEAVDVRQRIQGLFNAGIHRRDELHQRFGVVRGD